MAGQLKEMSARTVPHMDGSHIQDLVTLAIESVKMGLWSLDIDNKSGWVTPRTRELLHFAPDEPPTAETFCRGIHLEDREGVRTAIEQSVQTGEDLHIDYRIVLPDNSVRWIRATARRRCDATGRPECLIGTAVDITEFKAAEEALQKCCVEIKQLKHRLQAESDYLKSEMHVTREHSEIIGRSRAILEVLHLVEQVAPTTSAVLLTGETGTGKEGLARAIHRLSPRKNRLMVEVNCAALPEALVESELFGRERGAYTGALTSRVGRFELADGSTIFLDEVSELSPEVQAKLLRVLQEGQFQRLGDSKNHKVDVRVIAATNRDLAAAVRQGQFRQDLYYRLNVFPIVVPPLRERADDIPLLVLAFLQEFSSRMGKKLPKVPMRVMEALQRQRWPGNIRELRNVIERGVILSSGDTLQLPLTTDTEPIASEPMTLAEAEQQHILKTLEKTAWRIKGPHGAARLLGLKPGTLYSRMKKLGIPHAHERSALAVPGLSNGEGGAMAVSQRG